MPSSSTITQPNQPVEVEIASRRSEGFGSGLNVVSFSCALDMLLLVLGRWSGAFRGAVEFPVVGGGGSFIVGFSGKVGVGSSSGLGGGLLFPFRGAWGRWGGNGF